MKKLKLIIFLLSLFLLLASDGYTQGLQTVYDGRADSNAHAPSNTDVQLIRRFGLPKARLAWRSDQYCTEGFEAIDVATGSFTKANAQQRAVLFRFCVKGHDIGNNGIAIIEGNRIVANVAYNGGEDYSIQALADINSNGLSELVIGDGSSHQGYSASIATIIEISQSGVKNFGTADVFQDDCGANPDHCKTLAYKINVKPGTTPIFYREPYKKLGSRWSRAVVGARFALRKNERMFKLLD